MKVVRSKYLVLLVCGLIAGLVLLRIGEHRPASAGGNWLTVSIPVFGERTNSTGGPSTVSVCVSNICPRAVDFSVPWFECRAKHDRTRLTTNQLASVNIPLEPGASTNLTLTIDLGATAAPAQELLCCCQVRWIERRTGLRHAAELLNNWMQLRFNISLFEPEAYNSGLTFAANVNVAEYFRSIYGLPPDPLKDALAQPQALPPEPTVARAWPDEETKNAFVMFLLYCSSTNYPGKAARDTSPNWPYR